VERAWNERDKHPQRRRHRVPNGENFQSPNVGESRQRLTAVETVLWRGAIDLAIEQFKEWQHERIETFIAYLNHHRQRIVNCDYFKAEGISIGSGAIESTVKQIGGRIKLSGAQWNAEKVPQVLLHRCAYLNGQFSN